jgi:23S rRNA pseudouridine1911/1915/1917 synthase
VVRRASSTAWTRTLSGVMVAAKSDAAHQGLSRLFSTHDIDRLYIA